MENKQRQGLLSCRQAEQDSKSQATIRRPERITLHLSTFPPGKRFSVVQDTDTLALRRRRCVHGLSLAPLISLSLLYLYAMPPRQAPPPGKTYNKDT